MSITDNAAAQSVGAERSGGAGGSWVRTSSRFGNGRDW